MKTTHKEMNIKIISADWETDSIENLADVCTGDKNNEDGKNEGLYPLFVRSHFPRRIDSYSFDCEAILTAGDGKIGDIVHYINGKFDAHQRVYCIFNFDNRIHGYYFYLYFSNYFRNRVMQMTAKSTVDSVRMEMITKMNISFPSKPEQVAIATVLSDMNKLIEKLEQLIAKKNAIKQGAMQQLLTGTKRLPGFSVEWKVENLGEFSDVIKGVGLSKSQITNHGKYPCILYGELYTLYSQVISDVTSKTNVQDGRLSISGDILMPGSTTTLGVDLATASALLVDNVLLGGDINIIRIKDNSYNSIFLANYLTFFKEEVAKIAQGITVHHLYGRDLKNIPIKSPSYKEQSAIAAVLSDMDAEIVALEKSLKKYRQIKMGMMQQLLTGNIQLANTEATVSKKPHNKHFNEAVIIGVLADTHGEEAYPLGRLRRTKLMYFLHRKTDDDVSGYLKQAAGPYNPSVKYDGAEKIALEKKYVLSHKAGKREGFVAHDNITEAYHYFNKWYGEDALQWLEQFRYKKNDELELLSTVDMAARETRKTNKTASVAAVRSLIENEPKWRGKLSREIFNDENIEKALKELGGIFNDE